MAGDRIARALERIDAATHRIELAARLPVPGDRELERRYRDLWTHANSALSELDQLIGSLEP